MPDILVLGAGMVGVCTAVELQARGHTVTLVDDATPGCATSHGNAGIIQVEAAEPYALPRDLPTLVKIITGRTNDVTWTLPGVMSMAKPLLHYFLYSEKGKHARLSSCYSQLTNRAADDHALLIRSAKAEDLISRKGLCEVYRCPRELEKKAKNLSRLEREYGVISRVLDGAEYLKEEPAIRSAVAGAIHWPQSWSCRDPRDLTQRYASVFKARSGYVERGDALRLQKRGSSWILKLKSGQIVEAEHAVVCLGPWSPYLLREFGYRIPMILKRGYHAHYNTPKQLVRPFVDVKYGVVATSVSQGLRVTSGVSLVRHNSPSSLKQLNVGAQGLSEILELGPRTEEPVWYGTRPCMPDMLPLVGASPHHSNLWFNFGHGHQGFTLGPTTAHFVADSIDGVQSDVGSALAPPGRV